MARHQVTSFELLGMGGAVTRSLSGTAANERLSPYANAIETHRIRIFEVYLRYEEKKPVMLFDVTEEKIYAYPCKEFKKETKRARAGVADQAV